MYMANSLAELNSHIDLDNIIKGKNVKCVANSASILFNKAKDFYDKNNYENAYINFMKFYQCFVYIQASQEYKKDKKFYDILMGNKQVEAIEKAEELSENLNKIYRSENEKKLDIAKKENNRKSNKFHANINNIPSLNSKTSFTQNDVTNISKLQRPVDNKCTQDNLDITHEKTSNKKCEHINYITLENFIKLLKSSIKHSLPSQNYFPTFKNNPKDINEPFILVVDIRSGEDYKKAHIDFPFLINIPKDIINKNISNQIMQEWFKMSSFPDNDIPFTAFNCYTNYDYIIIIDYYGQETHLDHVYAETVVLNLFQGNRQNVHILEGGFVNLQRQYAKMIITNTNYMGKLSFPRTGPLNLFKDPVYTSQKLVNPGDHDNNLLETKQNHGDKLPQEPINYPDLSAFDQSNSFNMDMDGEISEDEEVTPKPIKSFLYPDENLRQTASKFEMTIKRREQGKNSEGKHGRIWETPKPKTKLSGDLNDKKMSSPYEKSDRSLNHQPFHVPSFNNMEASDKDIRNPAFLSKYGASFQAYQPNPEAPRRLPQPPTESLCTVGHYSLGQRGAAPDPCCRVAPYQHAHISPYPVTNHGPRGHVSNGNSYNQRPVPALAPAIVRTLHRVRSNPDLPKIHALVSDSLAATDDDFSTGLRRLNLAKNWDRDANTSPARREATSLRPPISNYRYGEESRRLPVPNVDRTLKPSSSSISCSSSTSFSVSTLKTTRRYEEDGLTSPGLLYDYSDQLNTTDSTSLSHPESSYISNESQSSYTDKSTSSNQEEIVFRRDAKALDTIPPSSFSRYRTNNELRSSSHGLTGILNTGNSCFINSTLQSLSHTIPLAEYFVNRRFLDHLNRRRKGFAPNRCLAAEFSNVCGGLWSGKHQSINPISFTEAVVKYIPGMEMGVQQDCHEFLTFLLDGLHEDLNRASKTSSNNATSSRSDEDESDSSNQLSDYELAFKAEADYTRNNDSIIVDLMSGQLKSVVQCQRGLHKSITFDTFQGLSLPLPSSGKCTLQDCLRLFLSPEPISDWKCAKCKKRTQASKELFLWKIPPILIIHLMRFKTEGSCHKKITTVVDFPLNGFDLTNYCAEVRQDERLPEYTLYAISNHYGTLEGGHYTAFCKNPINQRWYKYDDQQVMEISSADIRTPAAYLLFYTSLGIKAPDFL